MNALQVLQTYFYYLIHPFEANKALSGNSEGREVKRLSIYEALGASWVFIVINGMLRILLINALIFLFAGVMEPSGGYLAKVYSGGYSGFYFVVLTTILDVIFFPLVTLFVIQFWEFVIKSFARLAGVGGDIQEKTNSIISVALSSHVLQVAPVFGDMAQKVAYFIQMYAGIRVQLGFSRPLTLCVLMTPVLFLLVLLSLIVLMSAL